MQRLRVPLGFAVALTFLYVASPEPLSIAAGLPVALAGLGFRAAAAGVIRKNRELATGGPYEFTRNPLYFGSFLLALGFAVMGASILGAVLVLGPFWAIYREVIRREERELEALFPESFVHFRERVPGFFPRRIGPGILASFSVEQYLANREYNAAIGFLGAVLVLLAKTAWRS